MHKSCSDLKGWTDDGSLDLMPTPVPEGKNQTYMRLWFFFLYNINVIWKFKEKDYQQKQSQQSVLMVYFTSDQRLFNCTRRRT